MSATYYRSLAVDHTLVPSTQSDFPVLVSLTDATLKSVANGGHVENGNGFDIGFYSDSALTTKLKWEIDRYNPATGELVAWVKIASLSSSSDTVFYMGYGDTTITTDQSDKASTWSNSFIAVYHLGDGTTLSVADATGANNGTNHGVTATAGKIHGGGSFVAASTQYIYTNYTAIPNYITYSAWVKATSFPGDNAIIGRYPSSTFANLWTNSSGKLNIFFHTVGTGYVAYNGTGSNILATGTWYHVAAVYDSADGKARGYVNGVLDGTSSASGGVLTATETGDGIYIGAENIVHTYLWNGLIDEAHIASVSRSADWLLTEYRNQNAPGSFVSLGAETSTAVDVSVSLTGVPADPQIGVGTVEIGSVVVEPPVDTGGGGTGSGRPSRTGMRLRPTEDKAVYLKGVAASPRVGQVMLLHEMQRAYEAYSAPIRRAQARKPTEMPPGMRGLFKKVEKPIPPAVFVYQVGLPKLKSAVGTMTVKAFYEDIDEETIAMIDLL